MTKRPTQEALDYMLDVMRATKTYEDTSKQQVERKNLVMALDMLIRAVDHDTNEIIDKSDNVIRFRKRI